MKSRDRGKLGYSRPLALLRCCNECGYTSTMRGTTHKVWSKELQRNVYCGYMRIVRVRAEGECGGEGKKPPRPSD